MSTLPSRRPRSPGLAPWDLLTRLGVRLGPFLERLSCLFVLWLTHDEPRRAFAEQLRRRLPCRVFLVAHGQGLASADLSIVEVDAIARGAPLAL